MKYSTIIKNGTIINGTGTNSVKTDIAINKDKISKIGNLDTEKAHLTIDASGFYVTPGFIDLTTHSDSHWTIFSQPKQESFIRQGVTTILGGHGGTSLTPIIKKEALQSLSRWVNTSQININWQTTKEFFFEIKKHNFGVNFATLVGHETLRRNILDNARETTRQEIKEMNNLLEDALEEGVFGLSTNLSSPYSYYATESEIIFLLETIRKFKSISIHHLKDEGKNLGPSVSQLITFLRKSNSNGHISHFRALGRSSWEQLEQTIGMIELAQKQEVNLTCDFFPYISTGSDLLSFLPPWILSENEKKILNLLKNKETHQEIADYLKSMTLHYNKIIIASTERDTSSVGKSIKQISNNSGMNEEEVVINLLVINNLRVFIFNEAIQEKDLEIIAQKPYSMIASDSIGYELEKIKSASGRKKNLPHPRSFGAFPRALTKFVKEKNILNWENAIYKMTGLPAETLGIKDRGVLQKNNYADITIFDPETIKDKASYEIPLQFPDGIKYVFINGALALAEGELKDATAGQVLKKK